MDYDKIEKKLNCNIYFFDSYCAWWKGTNENTNGVLREFYPKGTDLSKVDKDELGECKILYELSHILLQSYTLFLTNFDKPKYCI